MIRIGDVMRGRKSGALYLVVSVSVVGGRFAGTAVILEPSKTRFRSHPKGDLVTFGRRWQVTLVGRNYKAR